ncbi:hypothetical protein STRIP9103_01488, partial [Streptomyces ipomoeae 91-03]
MLHPVPLRLVQSH